MDVPWDLLRTGDFAGAREQLAQTAEAEPPTVEVLHNLAVCSYKLGDFDRARAAAHRALAAFPDSHRTRYLLGLILKDAGEIDEAVAVFDALIERAPDRARAFYHRGTCHFRRARVAEAVDDLERAVTLEPLDLAARYNLGVAHVAALEWTEAQSDFAACVRLDPANADEYAELLVNIGRAQVCQRVYGQGHRLKNMLGIVGDRQRALWAEVRSRLSPGECVQADEIAEQHDLIFADLSAFLSTLQPSPLELDLVDVCDLVRRALFTASASSAHLRIHRQLDDVGEIVCDLASVHEAFLNIILNAAEVMDEGGDLFVRVSAPDDDHISVSFRDTGPGIDEATLARVFQFGYSTKVFGSGLGLSQARESVRMHGGRIDVDTAPGEGATFTVVLPTSPEIRRTLQDLTLRPVLFEDPQDLMMVLSEDEGLLIL